MTVMSCRGGDDDDDDDNKSETHGETSFVIGEYQAHTNVRMVRQREKERERERKREGKRRKKRNRERDRKREKESKVTNVMQKGSAS